MITIPPRGTRVLIATRSSLPWLNSPRPAIEGVIAHGNTWDKPDTIRLTGVDNCLGESVIALSAIVGLGILEEPEEGSQTLSGDQRDASEPMSFAVTGSRGDAYEVIIRGDQSSCSCPAGNRGRECRHVREIRGRLASETESRGPGDSSTP